MDKYERRRAALAALVAAQGRGGIAYVAGKLGKSASYVSRMLYEPGKKGAKRIGEDSVELLNKEFPGWLIEDHLSPTIAELTAVMTRLTSSGRMEETELQGWLTALKAREDGPKP